MYNDSLRGGWTYRLGTGITFGTVGDTYSLAGTVDFTDTWKLGGTEITATAEQLNALPLDVGAAGVATASKVLVLGSNKNVDTLVIAASGLKIGSGAGTAVTTTAAQLNQVTNSYGTVTFDRSVKVARVALAALDTGGGIVSWANPEAGSILIHRVLLDVTTVATAACTVDVGTTASTSTTSSDNLIDGLDTHSATGLFDNQNDAGSNGKSKQKLATGKWVTASMATGAAAGTVGFLYIFYVNV